MSRKQIVTISSSGSIVASVVSNESKIKCYDALSSNLKFTLFPSKETTSSISSLIFCNHDTHIVGRVGDTNTLIVWDLGRGVEAYRIQMQSEMQLCDITSRNSLITALVQSSKNKRFFALEYDITNGKLTRKIKAGSSTEVDVGKIQCSPCGNFYAVAIDSQIRVLHTETGKRKSKLTLRDACSSKTQLEFSSDGLTICYTGEGIIASLHSVEQDEKYSHSIEESKKSQDILSMSLYDNTLIMTYANGTSILILLKENKSVQSVHNISLEKGKILKAAFDQTSPHQKLRLVLSDDIIYCKTIAYRSDDETILLKYEHVITTSNDSKDETERHSKKAKFETKGDSNDYKYNEDDMTIAERLQTLNKETFLVSSSDEENKISKIGMLSSPKLTHTKAFSSILKQILQSNDDKTLEENVFKSKASNNKDVIINSISSLSSKELNILVCKIVNRAAAQPFKFGYNDILMHWMQAILVRLYQLEHIEGNETGKGTEEGKRALNMMRNLIMARVSNMEALAGLEARLAILGGDI